jgi:putative hydrolase of the HAD superfamily
MNAEKYKNLLFDFGNVIIDIDVPGATERVTSLLRKDANREVVDRILIEYECGRVSTDIFINTLLSQSERHVQALDIIEAWNSMLIGIPGYRLEMLLMLRDRYNVYLLSNTNELHIEWVRRYLEKRDGTRLFDRKYFDAAYYSHIIRARKPDAAIYQHVIDDALLTPGLTLFMDDVQANLDTAKQLGFGTYLVKPGEEIAEYLKVEGFY